MRLITGNTLTLLSAYDVFFSKPQNACSMCLTCGQKRVSCSVKMVALQQRCRFLLTVELLTLRQKNPKVQHR